MSKKSKLFNFVTLRNPELIDEDRKEQGFVFHPNVETSEFYEDASTGNAEQRYKSLKNRSLVLKNTDYILLNRTKIREAYPKLIQFSSWLNKNKNKLQPKDIWSKINAIGLGVLSDGQMIKLWDNLIYQTLMNQSTPVRETLIQLITSYKFLIQFKNKIQVSEEEFTVEEQKEFSRRAKANVAVPNMFLPEFSKNVDAVPTLSTTLTQRLDQEMEAVVAADRVQMYKKNLHTIELEEEAHFKTTIEAEDLDHENYVQAVKTFKANNKQVSTVTNPDGSTKEVVTFPGLDNVTKTTTPVSGPSVLVGEINTVVKQVNTKTLKTN